MRNRTTLTPSITTAMRYMRFGLLGEAERGWGVIAGVVVVLGASYEFERFWS